MRAVLLVVCLGMSARAYAELAPAEAPDTDELYYVAEEALAEPSDFELQTGLGYDFSNPYLNSFSGNIAFLYLPSPTWAIGLETTGYTSGKRANLVRLEEELGTYGFNARVYSPDWGAGAVLRYTPLSGRINFLSAQIINADISLALRGGVVKYLTLPRGPAFGATLSVALGFSSTWGMVFQTLWDMDKPDGELWQSRVGVRVGPTVRF